MLIGFFAVTPILNGMRLEEPVERIAAQFLSIIAIGIIPLFTYTVLRGFIDALGKTRTTMIITLLSLPINVILNYALILGISVFQNSVVSEQQLLLQQPIGAF